MYLNFFWGGGVGLSSEIFGQRLFPIGTLYDPFIARGLDSLNYGCYQVKKKKSKIGLAFHFKMKKYIYNFFL